MTLFPYTTLFRSKIEDIFTLNCSPFSIKESDKLQKWNNDLTDENKELYSIETRIKYVELPQIKNENNKIDELVVYVEVSGANSINVIKKTVDISNINNEIILNESNYFIPLENEILDNDAWKTIRDNLILLIKTKSIDINSDEEKLKNSFSFKVEDNENSTNGNGFNEFQNNLYCSFVQKESSGIYVNLYTNNSKIEESKENEITSKCIAYKIYIPFNEIISYKGGI